MRSRYASRLIAVFTAVSLRSLRACVDVEILPGRQKVVPTLFVAANPGRDDGAADPGDAEAPGRLGREDLCHRFVDFVALRAVGGAVALLVKRVVLGVLEASEVSRSRVRTVEQAHEVIGGVAAPAGTRELILPGVKSLGCFRERLDLEIHADADIPRALLPQVVILAVHGTDVRDLVNCKRLPVRQFAEPVAVAVLVAELVEQCARSRRIVR